VEVRPMDWLRRQYEDIKGNFKWAVLGLLWTVILWAVQHLSRMLHVPNFVLLIVMLVVSCVMFYLVARWQGPVQTNKQSSALMSATPDSVKAFDDMETFFQSYSGPLLDETKINVQTRADKYKPGVERETFLELVSKPSTRH
jgi:hypothetical protein